MKKPIFSLFAVRNELGHSTKGQIYISKIAIGAVVAGLIWLLYGGSSYMVWHLSLCAFVASKVCYYVNNKTWPEGWSVIADWLCDAMLMFGWSFIIHLRYSEWRSAAIMFGIWLFTYPWSSE